MIFPSFQDKDLWVLNIIGVVIDRDIGRGTSLRIEKKLAHHLQRLQKESRYYSIINKLWSLLINDTPILKPISMNSFLVNIYIF